MFDGRFLAFWTDNLGIRLLHAKPYHAWSKGKVERFTGTIQRDFELTLRLSRTSVAFLPFRPPLRSARPSPLPSAARADCDTASSPRESHSMCDRIAGTNIVLSPPTPRPPLRDGAGKCRGYGASGTRRRSGTPSPRMDAFLLSAMLHTFALPHPILPPLPAKSPPPRRSPRRPTPLRRPRGELVSLSPRAPLQLSRSPCLQTVGDAAGGCLSSCDNDT